MSRAILSWSSGKDCAWALHVCRRDGLADVAALLTTVNAEFDRVAMHGTRRALLEAQAAAIGLPLIVIDLPWPCSNSDYERIMGQATADLVAEGYDTMVFGDLFLEDIRAYREKQMQGSGLKPVFPLFPADTGALAVEMMQAGVQARVATCDAARLGPDFAGRAWDAGFLADLPPGIDPCGENGEFHTVVTAGPVFPAPLALIPGKTVTRDGFHYADLTLA